jgi:hypothetical protein
MAKNRQVNAPPLPSLCPRPCVLCRDVPTLVVGFFLVKDQGTKCEHKQWKNESREARRSSERGQHGTVDPLLLRKEKEEGTAQ